MAHERDLGMAQREAEGGVSLVTHQTPIVRIQDQAQACEAVARHRSTIIAALRKAGVQEAQARVVVEGVEAAGRTLREMAQ